MKSPHISKKSPHPFHPPHFSNAARQRSSLLQHPLESTPIVKRHTKPAYHQEVSPSLPPASLLEQCCPGSVPHFYPPLESTPIVKPHTEPAYLQQKSPNSLSTRLTPSSISFPGSPQRFPPKLSTYPPTSPFASRRPLHTKRDANSFACV